jgi:C1A family cysteine protease
MKQLRFLAVILAMIAMAACFGGDTSTGKKHVGILRNGAKMEKKVTFKTKGINPTKVIVRADGTRIRLGGCNRPDKQVFSKAPSYRAKYKGGQLPKKVDLRQYMTKVEDQGDIGSCTANATAGAYEYILKRYKGINFDISRLFLYYNSRAIENEVNDDCGAIIANVIKTISKDGVCDEKKWPYTNVTKNFKKKPSQDCYTDAKNNRVIKCQHVNTNLEEWKSALAEGHPIIFGVDVFGDIYNARNGKVPTPSGNKRSDGGHAMCCVGYSDVDRVFIVRNSWGVQWGDKGYGYFSYDYLMNKKFNSGDSWIIFEVSTGGNDKNNNDSDAWSNDNNSIFTYDDEFSKMDDATWKKLNDECGDYDMSYRLAALCIAGGAGDETLSDEEAKVAETKLQHLYKLFNLNYSASKVIDKCIDVFDEDFINETVKIVTRYFSKNARNAIAKDMYAIAKADELLDSEDEWLKQLIGNWIIQTNDDNNDTDDNGGRDNDDDYSYDDDNDDDYGYDDDDDDDYGYDDDDDEDFWGNDDEDFWDDDYDDYDYDYDDYYDDYDYDDYYDYDDDDYDDYYDDYDYCDDEDYYDDEDYEYDYYDDYEDYYNYDDEYYDDYYDDYSGYDCCTDGYYYGSKSKSKSKGTIKRKEAKIPQSK